MTSNARRTTRALGLLAAAAALLATLGQGGPASAEGAGCSATKIIRSMDDLFRADGQVGLMEMRVVRPETTRTLRMRFWFQLEAEGREDRSLVRVEAPAAERGVASLRVGNTMWSFVPSTGRVQQVPESMMLGSWMGSDWTNDDMVRESSLLDDYRASGCRIVDHEGRKAYRVELQAREGREVAWAKLVALVHQGGEDDLLPIREEFYSRRAGELVLARTMGFSDYRVFGDRRVPARMVLEPAGRAGRRTEMRYLSLAFGSDIPEAIFSLQALQRAR
jgi:hypothetical protein